MKDNTHIINKLQGGVYSINTTPCGYTQALKANYYKMSFANLTHTDARKTTFIMEKWEK